MQLICPLISSFRPVLPCPSLLLGRPVWGCTDHITQHSQLHAGLTRCKLLLLFIAATTRLLPALLRLWYSINLEGTEMKRKVIAKRENYLNHEKRLSFIGKILIRV